MRTLKEIVAGRKLASVTAERTVWYAAKVMTRKHVGAVVVVEGKKLQGILTERDILNRVIVLKRDPATVKVKEVMTRDPLSLSPGQLSCHAMALMTSGDFRHVPVVKNGRVIGVVSIRDAITDEHDELDRLNKKLLTLARKKP
jgi:CBS domain-containing protein